MSTEASSNITRRQQVLNTVAERLKAMREAAGYASAQDFCSKHDLALELYQQHEAGEKPITASYALKYSKLLNISVIMLMTGGKGKSA